jgi:hypothetical protein
MFLLLMIKIIKEIHLLFKMVLTAKQSFENRSRN